jgi:hyperosmotically inducible periplasmic protein
MKFMIATIGMLIAASPVFGQTSEQATEQGRQQNTQYAKDSALTTKVHTALANDVGMKTLTKINVDSEKGVVTLKGEVDSADTKRRAEEVAKRVSGVSSVKNELKVKS